MFGQQLRQLRLARGLSLEELSRAIDGAVTKQALSKYEQGKARPTPAVMMRLAAALGVKAVDLWRAPEFQIQLVAYRCQRSLGRRAQEQVGSQVRQALHERLEVQRALGLVAPVDLPIEALPATTLDEAERAAEDVRARWALGLDPIADLTATLEERHVHVLDLEADERFDGVAAVARDAEQQTVAAAVVTRRGVPGERQRLSLAHELGHLVLAVGAEVDGEQAAFRFGAAFLAPAAIVRREAGERRANLTLEELLLLKRYFGMSAQAILHRLHDLEIIGESQYRQWWIELGRIGWRRQEPAERAVEQPLWLRRNVLRAVAEGLISASEGAAMLGEAAMAAPAMLGRRSFMRLPLEERRRVLADQARQAADLYAEETDRELWQGGDIIEHT